MSENVHPGAKKRIAEDESMKARKRKDRPVKAGMQRAHNPGGGQLYHVPYSGAGVGFRRPTDQADNPIYWA